MPDEVRHNFYVLPQEGGMRLDRYLAAKFKEQGISREKVKELIKSGGVEIDGCRINTPKYAVTEESRISIRLQRQPEALSPESGRLSVLYRDPVLAVIDKSAGIPVHPAPGLSGGTLANRLLAHFPELAALDGFRPGIVHRLDKDTSGLMLVALTERCRLLLSAQFAERRVFKEYLAIVAGVPEKAEGLIEAPIGRDPAHKTRMAVIPGGKTATSAWRVLHADSGKRFSLVAIRIFTGRTHQVRVHMRHIGHPLVGDSVYGTPSGAYPPAARQMLHAWRLSFLHPLPESAAPFSGHRPEKDGQGRLAFICPPPDEFTDWLAQASRRMLRIVVTGSPGSGKSTLSHSLETLGLPLFSADSVIAALYEPGGDGHRLLLSWFGERFVPDPRLPVDKAALGKAMREDNALRRQVESLLHPLVWHALEEFWHQTEKQGSWAAVAEIPLYLENGRARDIDDPAELPLLVGVYSSFNLRKIRLKKNRDWSDAVIAEVESWQWPEDKKMAACDLVVDNTGDRKELEASADRLLAKLEDVYRDKQAGLKAYFNAMYFTDQADCNV